MTTVSVVVDTFESRQRSPVIAVSFSHCAAAPGLVLQTDGSLSLLRPDLTLHSFVGLKCTPTSLCVSEDASGLILAFVGDSTGLIWAVKLPELVVRGSFRASVSSSGVLALVAFRDVLWAGLSTGAISLFRLGDGVSTLPGRQAHSTSVLAVIPFEGVQRVLSVARTGHLCWWEEGTFDLEWESTNLLEDNEGAGSVVSAALNLLDKTLVLSEHQRSSLTFVRVLPTAESLSQDASVDVEKMMQGSDPDTRMYVLVQQYRQYEGEARRAVAQTIHVRFCCCFFCANFLCLKDQFFAKFPCPIDLGRQQVGAMKSQLAQLLGDPKSTLPNGLFDSVASTIFSRKRASIVDLTKTVFMDLCVKGIELRALTYDEGLVRKEQKGGSS